MFTSNNWLLKCFINLSYYYSSYHSKVIVLRKKLHDLLLTLINKHSEFEFIEEDSNDFDI